MQQATLNYLTKPSDPLKLPPLPLVHDIHAHLLLHQHRLVHQTHYIHLIDTFQTHSRHLSDTL